MRFPLRAPGDSPGARRVPPRPVGRPHRVRQTVARADMWRTTLARQARFRALPLRIRSDEFFPVPCSYASPVSPPLLSGRAGEALSAE